MPAKQPRSTSLFRLTLGGKESAGVFREVSGLKNESDVISHKYVDDQGKQVTRNLVGSTKWSNIECKRGVDEGMTLWQWRQQVIDGDLDAARMDCTIQLLDYKGQVISTYKVLQAIPVSYDAGTFNATANEVALESITLAHEGLERM